MEREITAKTITVYASEDICDNCEYFYPHYSRNDRSSGVTFNKINAGHCHHPRMKIRTPLDKACGRFKARH